MYIAPQKKLIYSEAEPKTAEIELTTPEIEVEPQKPTNQLENVSQMLTTLSKQLEKDMIETGFDGQIFVACPIIMICPNKK